MKIYLPNYTNKNCIVVRDKDTIRVYETQPQQNNQYYNYNDYSYYNKYSSIYNSLSSSNSPSGLSYEIIIDNYTKAILDDADHILLTGTIRANYDGELYLDDCKVEILE